MSIPSGLSFIEILISLFILAIMLLGLDAMQMTSLQAAKSAYYFSVAAQQLNGMAERLLAAHGVAVNQSLARWNAQNKMALPQGIGTVTGIYPTYVLTIYWGVTGASSCEKNTMGSSGCLQMPVGLS